MNYRSSVIPEDSSGYVESLMSNNSKFNSFSGTDFGISSTNEGEKELISYYIVGVSMIGVCCFGIVGNLLSLIVLTRRSVGGSTTNTYLISLAVADMFVLIATILTAIKDSRKPVASKLSWLAWQDAPIVPRAYPFCHATAVLFQVTSVWLTVAFAADRYLMICHPFWAKRWCTIKLAKIVIIIIYVFSVIYSIPRYFEYQIFEVQLPMNAIDWNLHDNNNNNDNNAVQIDENLRNTNVVFVQNLSTSFNTTSSASTAPLSHISPDMNITSLYGDFSYSMKTIPVIWYRLSEFGQSEQFRKVYHLWSWVLLVVGIPFVSIAIMNTFLILEVRKSSRKCVDQLKKREFRRQDTNIMLIGVIVIFFICQLPAAVSHIAWGLITLEAGSGMSWFLLNEIGNLLIVVNSAINLLPYYIFSRKFRRHFVRTFWPYRCIRDNGLHCIYIPEWATRSMNHYDDAEDSEMAGTSTLHNYHPRMNMRNFSNYRLSIHRNNSSSYRPRPSLPSNIRTSSCESQKLFSHIFRPVFYNTRRKKSKAASLSCESKPTLQMQMQDRGKGVTKGVLLNQCQNDEEAKDVAENHKIQKKDSLPCENNINNIDNTNNSNINNNTKSSSLHTLPYRGSNSSHSSVSFQIRDNVNQSSSLSSTSMPLRLLHCKKKSISEFKFSKSKRFHSKSEVDYSTRKLNRDCNDDGNDDDHEGTADDKDNINSKNGDNGDSDTATPSTEHLQSLEEVSSNPDSVDIA